MFVQVQYVTVYSIMWFVVGLTLLSGYFYLAQNRHLFLEDGGV